MQTCDPLGLSRRELRHTPLPSEGDTREFCRLLFSSPQKQGLLHMSKYISKILKREPDNFPAFVEQIKKHDYDVGRGTQKFLKLCKNCT